MLGEVLFLKCERYRFALGLEECLATPQRIRMACSTPNEGLSLMSTLEESDAVFLCGPGDSTGAEGKMTRGSL